MPYRALDPAQIKKTLDVLHQRISERFPESGLAGVCSELIVIARATEWQARSLGRPQILLRLLIYAAIVGGIAALIIVGRLIKVRVGDADVLGFFQGVEAAMNIVVLAGAALFFLVSIEDRIKRRRALAGLHELRSIAHVIDMHQLTKDPGVGRGPATASSPQRDLSPFQLTRYLDYCAEMLALTGKLAALYAQNLPDAVIVDAVNEIEALTGSLGLKIWQKIAILEAGNGTALPSMNENHQQVPS
jgi:hypothetical protein